MTTRLYEVHAYHYRGMYRWKIEAFAPGFPKPTVPIATAFKWTRAGVRELVEEWKAAKIIGDTELYWHDKKGRYRDRSTLPRAADPRGRG